MKLATSLLLACVVCITALAQSQTRNVLRLEGIYKGKDVYIKNPFGPLGVGFCSYEVRVNGEISSDEVNSSAFAVDLAQFALKMGEPVIIEVFFKDQCKPEFINPEAIEPSPTFVLEKAALSSSGMLSWTTRGESGKLPFRVEHKKWNKWVKVGEVQGSGEAGLNAYHFQTRMHHGNNVFRVVQRGGGETKSSDDISGNSSTPAVQLLYTKVYDKIELSSETDYELFDSYGELLAKGYGKDIDVRHLKKGIYYLNFDNSFSIEINKR